MKTFIKVAEIWVPDNNQSNLVLKNGIYGEFTEFKRISEQKQFAHRQGLPGMVWASGRPIVLTDLDNSYFERTESALQVGLTCAIGMPVFAGDFLLAVVVFLCGDDDAHSGAIEVWENDFPDHSNELGMVDGYYGTLEYFEFVSRSTKIMKGFGLPGLVWEMQKPILMEDLGSSDSFIRGRDAKNAGITTGLGIPVVLNKEKIDIMVFLSAKATPIAKRLQIWMSDDKHEKLYCHAAFGPELNNSISSFENRTFAKSEDLLGKVWLTGVPEISEITLDDDAETAVTVSILAVPVINQGKLVAVSTFLF